jgi:hypothetical protein
MCLKPEDLHDIHPQNIRAIKLRQVNAACSTHEESNAIKMLVGNLEGKRPFGRPKN